MTLPDLPENPTVEEAARISAEVLLRLITGGLTLDEIKTAAAWFEDQKIRTAMADLDRPHVIVARERLTGTMFVVGPFENIADAIADQTRGVAAIGTACDLQVLACIPPREMHPPEGCEHVDG